MAGAASVLRNPCICFTRSVGRYISLQGHDALPVLVTIDGHDRIGWLEAWRQLETGVWQGYVRHQGPDGLYLGWHPADVIRPDEQTDAGPRAAAADVPTTGELPTHPADE